VTEAVVAASVVLKRYSCSLKETPCPCTTWPVYPSAKYVVSAGAGRGVGVGVGAGGVAVDVGRTTGVDVGKPISCGVEEMAGGVSVAKGWKPVAGVGEATTEAVCTSSEIGVAARLLGCPTAVNRYDPGVTTGTL
jgi:hypothetical protein